MKLIPVSKGIKYIQNYNTDDNFEHKTLTFEGDQKEIYLWFDPANSYAETVIKKIREGITLESILFEDLIYKTGGGFNTNDTSFDAFLIKSKFKKVFKDANDHFNKLGNVFLQITTDENDKFASVKTIQPQKCRLKKNKKEVVITDDWKNYNKNNAETLPLYPKFKDKKINEIKVKISVYHIKNEALGLDHYGVNEKMEEALLLNEKEHRRNNWQLSQIKRGFKRDFFLVSEFELTAKEKEKTDDAFKKSGGDDYAGGVETLEGEGAKLVPATANYDFDFTKDDTSDQLFLKMGFPRSLIGIKSGAAFSVEQVESDYDQYLPKVESQQTFLLSEFAAIFNDLTEFNTKDWSVINNPPSIILQNYMQYMNDDQKNIVIDKVFEKYGLNG